MKKVQLRRILIITLAWFVIGAVLTTYDHFLLLSDLASPASPNYSFWNRLGLNTLTGLAGGLFGGVILTNLNRRLRTRPYLQSFLTGLFLSLLLIVCITLLSSSIQTLMQYASFQHLEAREFFRKSLFSPKHVKDLLFWSLVVMITFISLQVSDKFGPGNLWQMMIGKYHRPKEEMRVMMFLDLKASTAIAEKLGDKEYHHFLQDVFSDITRPILNAKGRIFQYVGDEVIVSWVVPEIIGTDACLDCFFDIQKRLESKESSYLKKFNLLPVFKAGIHYGSVVAGEIGVIKREITFSGDLINTTARIQSKCNELGSLLLVSRKLVDFLNPDPQRWQLVSKGFIHLAGKKQELELIAVHIHLTPPPIV